MERRARESQKNLECDRRKRQQILDIARQRLIHLDSPFH